MAAMNAVRMHRFARATLSGTQTGKTRRLIPRLTPGPVPHHRERGIMTPDNDWDLYAAHRAHVTDAIVKSRRARRGRLCILGGRGATTSTSSGCSGPSPRSTWSISTSGADARLRTANPATRARLICMPARPFGTDREASQEMQRSPPESLEDVEAVAMSTLESIASDLARSFDVVASACVLTQMSFGLREMLGDEHPDARAHSPVVDGHPPQHECSSSPPVGGTPLFVSDLVSSNFYPLEDLPPERNLLDVMSDIVETALITLRPTPTSSASFCDATSSFAIA